MDIVDANTKSAWMQFFAGYSYMLPESEYTSIKAKNGKIVIGSDKGVFVIDLVNDTAVNYTSSGGLSTKAKISDRNIEIIWSKQDDLSLNHNSVNDVGIMKKDDKEYIAAATKIGISVINTTDGVIHRTSGRTDNITVLAFGPDELYFGNNKGLHAKYDINELDADLTVFDASYPEVKRSRYYISI